MHPPRLVLIAVLTAVAALTGCGKLAPKSFDAVTVRRAHPILREEPRDSAPTSTTSPTTTQPPVGSPGYLRTVLWLTTLADAGTAASTDGVEPNPPVAQSVAVPAVPGPGLAPCDGDLPPCSRIVGVESGGRWDAHNSTGCVEHGIVYECWGPYQFSGSWAGKLGLPADLSTTTHDQWVNAARLLWNHGEGCANWSACR